MKNSAKIALLGLLLTSSTLVCAQPGRTAEDGQMPDRETQRQRAETMKKEIESQKIAFITSELQMTPEEAQSFWPLYNSYQAEKETFTQGNWKRWREDEGPKDLGELDERMKTKFAAERAQTDLDEKYYEKYKAVLPPEKVVGFYRAERDFKRKMMREMRARSEDRGERTRRGGEEGRPQHRQKSR